MAQLSIGHSEEFKAQTEIYKCARNTYWQTCSKSECLAYTCFA